MSRTVVAALAAAILVGTLLAAGCAGDDEPDVTAAGGLESGVLAAGSGQVALGAAAAAGGVGITVVGTGSARVAPDVAQWSFGVQTSGDTAAAALAANNEAAERIVAALRDAGVAEEDLRTEQVSVWPRTADDGSGVQGYDASNVVQATIRDLDGAGAVVDAAVSAGANQVYGPTLTVSDAQAQYRAAVDAAFDDARARAEAIAEKAGVTLGAPVAIVEGGGGVSPAFEAAAEEAAVRDVPIQPGTQEIGATLTVTFSIG
ncbi:MAG TPA: SIMPL domain-containing protein [Gaiellaceae bacterium]|nr:SIMPL domain-containing protein [Gaiellaceae bacterium]